jgi:nucleoid-associated protein YgaU
VKPGDTLMSIARKEYGESNASLWRLIRDANRGKVTGESGIKVGDTLVIPPKPGTAPGRAPLPPEKP